MKLLTKEIIKRIPPIRSQDDKPAEEVPIVVKFFNPIGKGTWYVTEGEQQEDGDWLFFGLARIQETELGYFMLSELESVELPLGMKIERDRHFGQHTLAEAKERQI